MDFFKQNRASSRTNEMIYLSFIFLTLIILFLPQSIVGVNVFDEGFIVSGAMLVNDGKLPYKDFLSMYGPGQYYLTAAVYRLFGEDLIYVRGLHIIIISSLGLVLYLLSKRVSNITYASMLSLAFYAAIVVYAQPNVGYPAITATLFLLISVFALIKWSESQLMRWLSVASLTIGIAGLFRWDFGVFGVLALLISVISYQLLIRINSSLSANLLPCFVFSLAPAVLVMTLVYVPLIGILSDPVQWYREVFLYSLTDFAKWRGINWVRPQFWSFLNKGSPTSFIVLVLNLSYLAIPILLAAGASVMAFISVKKHTIDQEDATRFVLTVFFALLCLFLLNQMRVRPGFPQGFPAIVTAIPIIAILIKFVAVRTTSGKSAKAFFMTVGILTVVLVATVRHEKWLSLLNGDTAVVREERYAGVHLETKDRYYIDLVRYIRAKTESNEAIYSGVVDHSRLFVNDPLIYFLTGRPPADRFVELEPGISNTSHGQEVIVSALKQKNVKLIVLFDMIGFESNQTSKSNGIHMLDNYIDKNYQLDRTFNDYRVYLRNREL